MKNPYPVGCFALRLALQSCAVFASIATAARNGDHMSERKRLLFSEGHFGAVLLGTKHITLRLYRAGAHDFTKNQVFYGEFPEGLALMLEATDDTVFYEAHQLPNEIAREDGYTGFLDAWSGLKKYYGEKLVDDSTIACIRFKVAEIYGEPVVKLTGSE